ncbi:ShlB/FhaC/HecB family hemolysin secretion/activation protein [Actinobacillus arthritidis]|uniref:ShlB/FhaC/HecB family hemolysin secretion/activation protein n=1 Tax=Actinobacillus arthritidis TaxID=157339 RepID=UPI00244359A1|nr:ShlB/FhaC/HecB family hemolysin secretion/activation protein [Actinobacillus arthritidis]WGE89976.1 ShlB/FhaC/HecB family hemolysin secretion/activation protein [Actinobacillus arthritidis]
MFNKYDKTFLWVLCLSSSLSYAKLNDPLNQEIQRLKHEKAINEAQQNLQKAEKFLDDTQKEMPFSEPQSPSTSDQIIKSIYVDIGKEKVDLDFTPIFKRYQGKALTSEIVLNLVKELTSVLYGKGYSTSAIGLKNGEIRDGNLAFIVHWGYVNEIKVNGESPSKFKDRAMISVLPTVKDKLLNIYDIDQFIDILSTNNKSANIKVVASEGYGKSDLNILTERTLLPTFTLGFNNSGTENNANGRNQVTANLVWSDLLGTNDTWSFNTGYRLYKQHNKNNQHNFSLGYVQPFAYYTLETRISQSDYEKEIKGIYAYPSSGKTKTANIKLSKILTRNKDVIFSLYSELEFKKKENNVANRKVNNLHHNKLTVGLSYISQLWNGKLYSDISFSNGLNWFSANKLAYNHKSEKTLRLISSSVNWHKPFAILNRNANYQMRIGMQYSLDSLYSDNQFSLGDEYTVRGFKGSVLSGDKGAYLSQTITMPFYPQKSYVSQISPFIGFDIGRAYQKLPKTNNTLAGVAGGIKAQIQKISLSLTYAKPLKSLDTQVNRKAPVYYVNGSITF